MIALSIPGWMKTQEVRTLFQWAKELPVGATVVEIGSLWGRSSAAFAEGAPSATIHCFDKWHGVKSPNSEVVSAEERVAHNIPEPYSLVITLPLFLEFTKGLNNIVPHKVEDQASVVWDGSPIDAVFLDANHRNPSDRDYLELFMPYVKPGGWIGGHDYGYVNQYPDVTENANWLSVTLDSILERADESLWRVRTPFVSPQGEKQ